MDKHSPTPWAVRAHLPDAHFEVVADAAGNSVGTATRPDDAAYIVEAVNSLAAALAHAVEDAQREANLRADRLAAFVRELADCLEEAGGDAFRSLIDRAREAAQ